MLNCNPQNSWCPGHLNNCCNFLAKLETKSERHLTGFSDGNYHFFSRKFCRLVGAGKNPNALPILYQNIMLPLGEGNSAYPGWESNEISRQAEPAFQREWSRGCSYKRRPGEQQQLGRSLRTWKSNGILSSLSNSWAENRYRSQAPSSYTKDIQFCHQLQYREQGEGGLPAGLSQASETPSHDYLKFKTLKGECHIWSTIKSPKLLVQGFVHFLTHEEKVFEE